MTVISRGKSDTTYWISSNNNNCDTYLSSKKEEEVDANNCAMTLSNGYHKSKSLDEQVEGAGNVGSLQIRTTITKTMASTIELKSQQPSFHCHRLYHPVEGLIKNKLIPSIALLLILASFNLPTCLNAPVSANLDDSIGELIEGEQVDALLRDKQSHIDANTLGEGELKRAALMLLLERAERQLDSKHATTAHSSHHLANQPDDSTLLLVLLADQLPEPQRATSSSSSSSSPSARRLNKRSGISDQRLAEIQMIRALKKQLERASKMATGSNLNNAGQEAAAS